MNSSIHPIDHRDLNHQLDLYHISPDTPGMVLWHPNGCYIFERLQQWLRLQLMQAGYQEVRSPIMMDQKLWQQSGHWDKFQDNMFAFESGRQHYALKPMNCPAHILMYQQKQREHNHLPVRYFDFSPLSRNEPGGSLHGILRLRNFHQDDGHVFVRPDQLADELRRMLQLMQSVLNALGFHQLAFHLALRPKHHFGTAEVWDQAEKELEAVLSDLQLVYKKLPDEGAFYGPKIECHLQDSAGRRWQCGTVQLDYLLPQRMKINYRDRQGHKQPAVLIHRALLGSIERFIGIWLEECGGKLPLWCHPQPLLLLALSREQADFCRHLVAKALGRGIQASWQLIDTPVKQAIKQAWSHPCRAFALIGEKEVNAKQWDVVMKGADKQQVNYADWSVFLDQFDLRCHVE